MDEVKMDVDETTSPLDDTADEVTASPETIRELRERLDLSRRDVELGTELSSSVVWRSEQVGRKVSDEEQAKIWNFLVKYEVDHPEGKPKSISRTARQRAASDTGVKANAQAAKKLAEAEKARDEWRATTWKLRQVVDDVYVKAVAALNEAKAKKRSTADLKAIVDALHPHVSD